MFKSKIHGAVVTHADLHGAGNVTIGRNLLGADDILTHEEVHIWNVTRGTGISTCVLEETKGSGHIRIDGAAAHLMPRGDSVMFVTSAEMDSAEARNFKPRLFE
ncbi:MAG: aspartate 1-decarboxylase [Myxococcota bacterium]|nr:aspartate 1-decarboxylase [Myxococcota bacterium]